MDLGATWIHGSHGNPITALAQRFGLPTAMVSHTSKALGLQSRLPSTRSLQQEFRQGLEAAKQLARRRGKDLPLTEAVAQAPLPPGTTHSYAYDWGLAWLGLITGVDPDQLSTLYWNQDEEFPGPDRLFPEGYDGIAHGLATGLDLRLGQHVHRLEWGEAGVVLETDQGRFSGAAAIITLPLGVLQTSDLTFIPPLPVAKQQAMARLGMGVLDKISLYFPRAFWPGDCDHLGPLSTRSGESIGLTSMSPYGLPLLIVWVAGRFARALEACDDATVLEHILATLRQLFGARVPEPTHTCITRWGRDPFARGSYSYIPVGASGADYDRLAEPIGGCLFFAGEATSRLYPATVHGAYLSGVREAHRVLSLEHLN